MLEDEWSTQAFWSLPKPDFRMSSTSFPPIEIGSLTATSAEESQFIGSSSGVFFVNTVHRAFAKSKKAEDLGQANGVGSSDRDATPVASFVVGNESPQRSQSLDQTGRPLNHNSEVSQASGIHNQMLGFPPSQASATGLIMVFFQTWHPLFPFLHGPTFLQDVEDFYEGKQNDTDQAGRPQICRAVVLQCVFNLAALDRPDIGIPDSSRIESTSSLLSLLGIVAAKHDIIGLQALLAMQLYLIATMSLRAASTVGGVLVKLLFHGGFHRCPSRYSQISRHDCDIRKRIFWSAYATDRYLSQALGHPLGMQDSDIDVCLPGTKELHLAVPQPSSSCGVGHEDTRAHLPYGHPDLAETSSDPGEQEAPMDGLARSKPTAFGEDVLTNYVSHCRITGRALELFHKSLHTRSVDHRHITLLTSEVHSWWNSLPQHLQERTSNHGTTSFFAFFNFIYQSLIILMNRPFLSLNPSTPEFRLSLQTCVGASREMILISRNHGTVFSWPGILSGTWMAGLVLAFGCELGLYPFAKGAAEIDTCLSLLRRMSDRFSTAQNCSAVLSILLKDLHAHFDEERKTVGSSITDESLRKRRKVDTSSSTVESQPYSPAINRVQSATSTQPDLTIPYPTQMQYTQPDFEQQRPTSVMPWQDPIMSEDIGDVFGQVSWEALFHGDGSGWDDCGAADGV